MSKNQKGAASQRPLILGVLKKHHTHHGEPFKAGDTIQVTEDQRAWLARQGVIDGQQKEHSNG